MNNAFVPALAGLLIAALLAGCIGGDENGVQTPSTVPVAGIKDTKLTDSDVPVMEEDETVDIGDMAPKTAGDADDQASELRGDEITLMDEEDTLEIGQML